jgi:uncharacterized membrane protein
MEGFSDNVFGFALTLLVVSLEVPRTFTDLQETFRGFIAFALAFALLFSIWHDHYKFFRRYGLENGTVIWLNALLLFVTLFFVYPLKFLFTFLVKMFSGISTKVTLPDGTSVPSILPDQWVTLMTAYGLGFIIIYGVFALLYAYAYRKREELALTNVEMIITRSSIARFVANCIIALCSILIIITFGVRSVFFSGMMYGTIGIVQFVIGWYYGRLLDRASKNTAG